MKGNRAHCGPSGFLGPSVLPQLTHLLGLQALSSARLGLSWGGGGEERGEKGGCLCLSLPGSQVHWDNFVTHLEPQNPPPTTLLPLTTSSAGAVFRGPAASASLGAP